MKNFQVIEGCKLQISTKTSCIYNYKTLDRLKDFNKVCMGKIFQDDKDLIEFGDRYLIFKVTVEPHRAA